MHRDRRSVLIAEHNHVLCESIATQIAMDLGVEVVQTPGGEAALKVVEMNRDVLVVVANVQNPNTNGVRLTRQIKDLDPSVSVILMTNEWDEDLIRQATEAGVDERFTKDASVGIKPLVDMVRGLLDS